MGPLINGIWRPVATRFFVLLIGIVVLGLPVGSQEAPPSPSTSEASEQARPSGFAINFNNVGIIEYIRFISKISGTNFVFDPADLDFRVTIVSEDFASIENIMSILLQVLQVHGLRLQEEANQILIYREASLGQIATVFPEQGEGTMPPIVTRVFHIENGNVTDAEAVIKPLLSASAAISSSPATNHLIVTDVAGNIEKIAALIRSLGTLEIAYFEVKYSHADAIAKLAETILEPIAGKELRLVPQGSTDTVFIVGTPHLVRRALGVLQMLDVPAAPTHGPAAPNIERPVPTAVTATGPLVTSEGVPPIAYPIKPAPKAEPISFFIYKLEYHQGDEISLALQEIARSLEAAEGTLSDLGRTISTVQWIKATNSLVISGPQAAIERVSGLIQDLDIPLREVYIESLVIRTTQTNTFSLGVEWGFKTTFNNGAPNPDVVQGAGGSTQGSPGGVPSALNARLNPMQIPTPIPLIDGLSGGVIGRFVNFNGQLFTSLGLLVSAMQSCDDTTILLNPKILTLDNHEARNFVGSNIAFQASTITQPGSETVVGEIVYRDIGASLIVKPLLSNSDMVTINIALEISANAASSATGAVTATLDPTLKSDTETRVTVPNGYFLVIAGQINDTRMNFHDGLPCLGGLPIIGTAFSTKSLSDARDNVIIFLRPHIIHTKPEMVHLTECEKLRTDYANKPGQYQMDLETILDVLNIKPEDSKPCCNPATCAECGYPCWRNKANTCRPCCYHDCDSIMDRYFRYPCDCP
jgi:type III secretion protein C